MNRAVAGTGRRAFGYAVGSLAALLLLGIPELDAGLVRQRLWAFDHLRDVPRWARLFLALLLLAVAVPRVQRALGWIGERLRSALERIPWPGWLRIPLVGGAFFSLFWIFRQRNFELGDSALLTQLLTRFVHLDGYHVTYDEPLDLYLHSLAYRLLHEAFGWAVEDAYALLSSLAGLGFVAVMWLLWSRILPDAGRRALALGLVVTTASVQLFFGYVENYTLVALGLMLYVLLAREYLEDRCRLVWPALVLGISLCLHVLAGWLLPSLFYLWLARRRRVAELLSAGLGVLVPVAATVAFLTTIGVSPSAMQKTHLAHFKFVFFIEPGTLQYQFAAFSTAHLLAQANELALVALPGLLALLGAVLFVRRKMDGKDPFLRFLVISTVFVQLFASTWNPELGAYADWDLFAVAGLFYALLGAYALAKFAGDRETLCHVGGTIVAVCLVLTGSWVASNATRHVEVDALHDDAHLRSGYRHARQGRLEAAVLEFEEVLRINPRNGDGLLALGRAHWDRGERERARPLFETYLQLEPHGPQAERVRQFLARARSSM